ncbi:MAG: bile acid:sodium symporter, partial [Lentisphaeria bacterium]|nr:bile acid:sodium symporter [Lentisphaeria bacterium]
MFKKLFLPVGMIVAVIMSFTFPEIGIAFKGLKLNNLLIIAIFLVCGWQTTADVKFDRKFLLIFISGALITLIAAPVAGWGIAGVLRLDPMSAVGLMVIAAMPPTLSSGVVMTGTAG